MNQVPHNPIYNCRLISRGISMYLKSVSWFLFLSAWGWHSHRNKDSGKTTVFRVALGITSDRVKYTNTTDPAVSFVLMACFQIVFISRGFVFTWDWSWPTWTKYAIQHCLQISGLFFREADFPWAWQSSGTGWHLNVFSLSPKMKPHSIWNTLKSKSSSMWCDSKCKNKINLHVKLDSIPILRRV